MVRGGLGVLVFGVHSAQHKSKQAFSFLLSSGLLSLYLMLDDLFQVHEDLVHRYFGLDEKIFIVGLGVLVLTYFISFRRLILQTEYLVLLLALGFLGTSAVVDIVQNRLWRLGDWEYFLEYGAKWLGITSWCSYYVRTSYHFLVASPEMAGTTLDSVAKA